MMCGWRLQQVFPEQLSNLTPVMNDIVQVCTARIGPTGTCFIRCVFLKFSDSRDSDFDCEVDSFIQFLCIS